MPEGLLGHCLSGGRETSCCMGPDVETGVFWPGIKRLGDSRKWLGFEYILELLPIWLANDVGVIMKKEAPR